MSFPPILVPLLFSYSFLPKFTMRTMGAKQKNEKEGYETCYVLSFMLQACPKTLHLLFDSSINSVSRNPGSEKIRNSK